MRRFSFYQHNTGLIFHKYDYFILQNIIESNLIYYHFKKHKRKHVQIDGEDG